MQALRTREEAFEAEQVILRSLCQHPFGRRQREEIERILAGYQWQSSEHQILFEVLHQSQFAGTERFREQLPAILTRKGFPDIDLRRYFAEEATPAAEALRVARELAERTSKEQ